MNITSKERNIREVIETVMRSIFFLCGIVAVLSVLFISLYMILSGGPAIFRIGVKDFLLGTTWYPDNNQFGILPMILSSLIATICAVIIAIPLGLCMAIFLSHIASPKVASVIRPLIDLLAGIPSVVYGLLGAVIIVPMIFKLQTAMGLPNSGCLLAAIIVLVIMILPTIISVSESSIRAVPNKYNEASLALGASKMQSIFCAILPAAKSGIITGAVLGTGRAIGETMAVMMVAGNASILPSMFGSVRLMTVAIPMEWAYSSGLHREALYGIGLVLFIFILLINIVLNVVLKKGGNGNAR